MTMVAVVKRHSNGTPVVPENDDVKAGFGASWPVVARSTPQLSFHCWRSVVY